MPKVRLSFATMALATWCAVQDVAAQQASPRDSSKSILIGRVVDTAAAPISAARIRLLRSDSLSTTTNDSGMFRFVGLAAGANAFAVRRFGFEPMMFTAMLEPATTHRTTVVMLASTQRLPAVSVSDTTPATHWLDAFRAHRSTYRGTFLTRADFVRRNPKSASDIVARIPGFSVGRSASGRNRVTSTRTVNRGCAPTLYLHGSPFGGQLDDIPVDDIEALEVYVGVSEVPAEFDRVGRNVCAVVNIWTRDPGAPLDAPVSPRAVIASYPAADDSSRIVVLTLASQIFGNSRGIRVYLPPGYDSGDTTRRYPTLFLNDGSAVFSPRLWNAPKTLDSLIRLHLIPPLVVVGIDNAATIPGTADPSRARANEYLPYPDPTEPDLPSPQGEKYPAFLVNEVMPLVARSFRVLEDSANVGLGGSSYGGIAALTTALRYPGRFGRLLLESTPLFLFNERLIDETSALGARPGAIYVGLGTRETSDSTIGAAGTRAIERFVSAARDQSRSRVQFTLVEGAGHNGAAWGARLPVALTFLYGW